MSNPENILAQISAAGYSAATRDLPPAHLSKHDTLEAPTVTVDGRRVVVTFKRFHYRHHKHAAYCWRLESARYFDDES